MFVEDSLIDSIEFKTSFYSVLLTARESTGTCGETLIEKLKGKIISFGKREEKSYSLFQCTVGNSAIL